jgi:hypothetical protein
VRAPQKVGHIEARDLIRKLKMLSRKGGRPHMR